MCWCEERGIQIILQLESPFKSFLMFRLLFISTKASLTRERSPDRAGFGSAPGRGPAAPFPRWVSGSSQGRICWIFVFSDLCVPLLGDEAWVSLWSAVIAACRLLGCMSGAQEDGERMGARTWQRAPACWPLGLARGTKECWTGGRVAWEMEVGGKRGDERMRNGCLEGILLLKYFKSIWRASCFP